MRLPSRWDWQKEVMCVKFSMRVKFFLSTKNLFIVRICVYVCMTYCKWFILFSLDLSKNLRWLRCTGLFLKLWWNLFHRLGIGRLSFSWFACIAKECLIENRKSKKKRKFSSEINHKIDINSFTQCILVS